VQLDGVLQDENRRNNSFIGRVIELNASGRQLTSLADAKFDRQDLLILIRDILVAGDGATASALLWAFVSFANNPDVQSRLQSEIDDVIGRDRQPLLDDEFKMPYTQAVILDTLRLHTVAPLSIFRATTCDTVLGDYFIPAQTTVRL
jgi:cytochrome P450